MMEECSDSGDGIKGSTKDLFSYDVTDEYQGNRDGLQEEQDTWDCEELFANETAVLLDTCRASSGREVLEHSLPASQQRARAELEMTLPNDEACTELQDASVSLISPQQQQQVESAACSGMYLVAAATVAALGGIVFGYDAGIISGAMLQLRETFHLSCQEQEIVVGMFLLGALLASFTGGFLVDQVGRRPTIVINACIFVLGAAILAAARHYAILIIGRLVVGFATSLSATTECIYISEISPAKRRGFLVSLNELGICLGFLLAYTINYAFITTDSGWRYMFGLSAIPAAIQGLGMLALPPSPRYLMLKGKEQQANQVLRKLHGPGQVESELSAIKLSLTEEKASTCRHLFGTADNLRARMFTGMGLVFLQQVSGHPNVLYYAPTVFKSLGFHSSDAATLATVGLGTIKVVSTIFALLIIDHVDRRKFLLFGTTVMTISLVCLGVLVVSAGHQHTGVLCGIAEDKNASQRVHSNSNISVSDSFPLHQGWRETGMNPSPDSVMSQSTMSGKSVILEETAKSHALDLSPLSVKWGAFVCLFVFIFGYAFSFGPGTWLILSEIFPSAVKGRAISLATSLNWGTNLIISFTFLDVTNAIGVGWTFLLYSAVCALAVKFIFWVVPETRGKSLEQISKELKSRSAFHRCKCHQHFSQRYTGL